MSDAAEDYARMVDAVTEQRRRLGLEAGSDRWSGAAARFQADPTREPDANLRAVLEYIAPQHSVLDVGGGAGRFALPIALRCREVINVEPSRGMGEAFEASARAAGIGNARWLQAAWPDTGEIEADISLVVHVTYFVRDIVPFVEKLVAATRERVIIGTTATPPPNQASALFRLLHGEAQQPLPGYRHLLPVLWEMGILPDVRVLATAEATALGGVSPSREEAVRAALASPGLASRPRAELEAAVLAHFDELFVAVPGGFRRRPEGDPRFMLITWRTDGARP